MKASEFDAHLEATPSGCLIWTMAVSSSGYGSVWIDGVWWKPHRFAWYRVNGDIPAGLMVLHSCDTPLCCNAEHLSLGTNQDNVNDAVSKGRNYIPPVKRGSDVPSAVLQEADVLEIRRLCSEGVPQRHIAQRFGIGSAQVSRIHRRVKWRHL